MYAYNTYILLIVHTWSSITCILEFVYEMGIREMFEDRFTNREKCLTLLVKSKKKSCLYQKQRFVHQSHPPRSDDLIENWKRINKKLSNEHSFFYFSTNSFYDFALWGHTHSVHQTIWDDIRPITSRIPDTPLGPMSLTEIDRIFLFSWIISVHPVL